MVFFGEMRHGKRAAFCTAVFILLLFSVMTSCRFKISEPLVYVGGAFDDGVQQACYWINGRRQAVPDAGANINSIFVTDGRVYLAGTIGSGNTPCFWEGTTGTELEPLSPATTGNAQAIAVSRGTVYVAGYGGSLPCVWTNGTPTILTPTITSTRGVAYAVQVLGNTVYIAGSFNDPGTYPCYWANNISTTLDFPPGLDSAEALTIHVSEGTVHTAGLL
jgi:hypothetical protein